MTAPDAKRLNHEIIASCEIAPRKLERAWGKGGDQGRKKVEEFDNWFRELAYKIVDAKNDGHISDQAENAALEACKAILALKRVPHWEHPDDIALIRATLRMGQGFDDYPEKQTIGFEESDDDE